MKNIASKNKNSSKKIVILIIVAILLVATGAAVYYLSQNNNSTDTTSNGTSNSQTDAVTDTDGKGTDQPATLPNNSQDLTTDDVPVSTSASAVITRLEEKDSVVHFSAKVSGVKEVGRCVITFSTPNDRPVTKEFDAVKSGADYICAIDVSSLEFSYLGKWSVNLRYYSGDTQVTVTSEVTIS